MSRVNIMPYVDIIVTLLDSILDNPDVTSLESFVQNLDLNTILKLTNPNRLNNILNLEKSDISELELLKETLAINNIDVINDIVYEPTDGDENTSDEIIINNTKTLKHVRTMKRLVKSNGDVKDGLIYHDFKKLKQETNIFIDNITLKRKNNYLSAVSVFETNKAKLYNILNTRGPAWSGAKYIIVDNKKNTNILYIIGSDKVKSFNNEITTLQYKNSNLDKVEKINNDMGLVINNLYNVDVINDVSAENTFINYERTVYNKRLLSQKNIVHSELTLVNDEENIINALLIEEGNPRNKEYFVKSATGIFYGANSIVINKNDKETVVHIRGIKKNNRNKLVIDESYDKSIEETNNIDVSAEFKTSLSKVTLDDNDHSILYKYNDLNNQTSENETNIIIQDIYLYNNTNKSLISAKGINYNSNNKKTYVVENISIFKEKYVEQISASKLVIDESNSEQSTFKCFE